MEEQVPMIDSKLKLQMKTDPVTDADAGTNKQSRFKSEKSAVKTHCTPTNIIPEVEEDDLIIPSFIMPNDDYYADGAVEMDTGKLDGQLVMEKEDDLSTPPLIMPSDDDYYADGAVKLDGQLVMEKEADLSTPPLIMPNDDDYYADGAVKLDGQLLMEKEDDLSTPSLIMPNDDDYYADGAVDEMDRGKLDGQIGMEKEDDLIIPSFIMANDDDYYADGTVDEMDRGKLDGQLGTEKEDDLINPSFIMPNDDDYYAGGAVDEMDRGKPDAQLAIEKDEMAYMEWNITQYRSYWETIWGKTCSSFSDITTLSSMQFTHLTPEGTSRYDVGTETTLQIFTIKLTEIKGGFRWPLSVYGLVAARDHVDGYRNLLFFCDSTKPQELSKDDPFLRLIGPSRAIVLTDTVDFEIQLKVKRSAKPDRTLITDIWRYTCPGVSTFSFKNCFCTAEVCLEQVKRSVQATILGVRVVKCGSWPSEHGCRVAAYPSTRKDVSSDIDGITNYANLSSRLILLLDSKDGKLTKSSDGYLNLSRQVVSVQLAGKLEVVIESYLPSGVIAERGLVCFKAKDSHISQDKCLLGDAEVEITVAWSLLVKEQQDIESPDFLDGF